MDWFDRLGAMYAFLNDTPALAHDMTMRAPQTDFSYTLAYAMQNTAAPIDVYPADTQTLAG
jgi:hypothetical protein